jgi:16S rRNA (guanine966-N2)-methyltransferase
VRIIAGKAGRRKIRVPKTVTRPTTDFVRQALFSMLGARVEGARVLDLFAGSGALGLEALSRGAASCVFVDEGRGVEKVIEGNLEQTGLDGGRVIRAEVHGWLKRDRGRYDLIFADPPYARSLLDRDHVAELLDAGLLVERLADGGLLAIEQAAEAEARAAKGLDLLEHRTYGGSSILLYAPEARS